MRTRAAVQSPLFDLDDVVIPDTLRVLKKGVAAIHATPIREEDNQSLNGRRVFDAAILVAQLDMRSRDPALIDRIRDERISPLFETRITDLARLASIPGKNYERIYKELNHLFEMVLRWNVVGEDSAIDFDFKAHFFSSLGFGKGLKRGLIRFSFDPAVLDIILEPRNWAALSLQAMRGLETSASYALYQATFRYINTHAKVTAALPTETWIELLVGKSRYVTDDPDRGKRAVNYADFKRRVLLDAMRRVNDLPALSYALELKEIRSGQRIAKLQFKLVRKQVETLGLPLSWPTDLLTVLQGLGFSETEISEMSQSHSYEEVADAVVRLKKGMVKLAKAGRPISSRKRYFSGILANIAQGVALEAMDDAAIENEARQRELEAQAEQRQQRIKEAFSAHQTKRFNETLFGMPEGDREAIFAAFEETPEGQRAKSLLRHGWSERSVVALAVLRNWLITGRPDLVDSLLPNPEDRTLEAWMAWRIDQAS
ncbi:MAG: replication initiation protein [Polaromonas sp.]|nr:replication initiation protein [Polaromonas sp.]